MHAPGTTWGHPPPAKGDVHPPKKAAFIAYTKKAHFNSNTGFKQSFSQARCAASCSRNHSFVRARRGVLETKDLPPSFLTWEVCSKRRAHFNSNAGRKQSPSQTRCAASSARNHSFVRALVVLETKDPPPSLLTWRVCSKRRAHFKFSTQDALKLLTSSMRRIFFS
jgi:hypothetical protein